MSIFVVDDEPAVVHALTAILCRKGYDAQPFTNPLEALHAADAVAPDLLLTDVVMPQMNGLLLATEMTERHPACRVLLISGNATFIQEYVAEMRYQLLEKPAAVADILAAVDGLLGSLARGQED